MSSDVGPAFHFDLRAASSHLVDVALQLQPTQGRLQFSLPSWTPGSYLIRDYVRQLEDLTLSQNGTPLALRRVDLATWQVQLPNLDPVLIRYRILATELTVRTCHLNTQHAFLALAAVALLVEGERWSPHHFSLDLPPGWDAFVPLPRGKDGRWTSSDFDQLVDTPIEAGPHREHHFAVGGIPHRWVTWGTTLSGEDPLLEDSALMADVQRVCLACCRLLGLDRPAAEHYLFVLHLTANGYGGLEHDNSAVLQYGRCRLQQIGGRRKLLQLVAHEYLHQWNVRRLRPMELCPYDFSQAAVTPNLWFAEGLTSYFDQLLPYSAGLCSQDDLLQDLGADLSRFLLTPGRHVQSLRLSSQEAWVKLYKADAYASNNQISYYLKGAVLALVLDLHLRRFKSSLPEVLRQLWQSHGKVGRGYREDDLLRAFANQAPDLTVLLPNWLNSTEDFPLQDYLADVGLVLHQQPGSLPQPGWDVQIASQGLVLKRVLRHSPAEKCGLMVGDELIALDGQRLRQKEDIKVMLETLKPQECITVLYVRDERVHSTTLGLDPASVNEWCLQLNPAAGPESQERRRRWLMLEAP